MLFSLLLPSLAILTVSAKQQLRDCVRPWQSPVLSVPTLLSPSRPLECRPETPASCPRGRNSVCQFSLRYYKYICCQDSPDAEPPLCPKFHDSLQLVCGISGNVDGVCPREYRCLPSRTDPSLRLCCRPNSNISHPEPETTFRENRLVPQTLPFAPRSQMEIVFDNTSLVLGQLLDKDKISLLDKKPELKVNGLDEENQYAVVFADSTSKQVVWLMVNAAVQEGRLLLDRTARTLLAYSPPSLDSDGVHVIVAVVFQQTGPWKAPRVAADDFSFKEFISSAPIEETPVTGGFYAFTTAEDERI